VKENGKTWHTSKEAYAAIKAYAKTNKAWDWARSGVPLPKKRPLKMILFLLLVLLLLPLLLLAVIGIHFFYERREKPFDVALNEIPIDKLQALKSTEDIIYQNLFSPVYETKGGLRKIMLKLLLAATNFSAKNWFVEGELMGTPTIHFARWAFIDDGKRFVFFSNFDGSFDGYLGDFVDNNGWGLNAIYGAAKGYPTTFYLFGRGSYNLQQFMGWGRMTQVQSPMWYSAYPWTSLPQIVSRAELSASIFDDTEGTEEEIKRTLRNI